MAGSIVFFSYVYFQSQEALLKKKLQVFLTEMLKMGTVKGFKYFAMYMRGREEMVLSVVNQPQVRFEFDTHERKHKATLYQKITLNKILSSNKQF